MPRDNILNSAETAIPPQLLVPPKERPGFRNLLGTRRTDRTPPGISDPEQELTRLRKLLSEQEAQGRSAQERFFEANRQLKAFETETNRVRTELKRAQDDLAGAKTEFTRDLHRATEREAGLLNDLAVVRAQMAKARDRASVYKKLAALCLVLLIPALSWAAVNYRQAAAERGKTARASRATLAGGGPIAPPHDFTIDVRRLDLALNHFRHESAEAVLRRVHDTNAARGISVCPFEWNDGHVSLLFGNQPGAGLAASLTQCADAVEQAAKKKGS